MESDNKLIKKIGIRRETKTDEEQRCALPPAYVAELIKKNKNLRFYIQPSEHRIFKDKEFEDAGAQILEDLSECELIIGVKEIGVQYLIENKTYMIFPHVIKGQPANMDTLDVMVEKNIRLIDYERIVDENNNRLIAFGFFAGVAGAIDFLHGLGQYFLLQGITNSFQNIKRCKDYYTLEEAKQDIRLASQLISSLGLFHITNHNINSSNQSLLPFVMAITGRGRCSSGVLDILSCLNFKFIEPEQLESLFINHQLQCQENPNYHDNTIYMVQLHQKHMAAKNKTKNEEFDGQDYKTNPQDYHGIFHKKYLKYINVLFHAMYWDQRFPRLISDQQMKKLTESKESRLIGILDITCDFQGSIQFCKKFTTVSNPYYMYEPVSGQIFDGIQNIPNAILYESLDYLPAMLPYDSSMYFGKHLVKWIENIVYSDQNLPFDQQGLMPEIQRAVITSNRSLTTNYQYIKLIRKNSNYSVNSIN